MAVQDIKAGEEITVDYRTFRYDIPWDFVCRCRTNSCPRIVRSSVGGTPPKLAAEWARRMAPALAAARTAIQEIPLKAGQVDGVSDRRLDEPKQAQ